MDDCMTTLPEQLHVKLYASALQSGLRAATHPGVWICRPTQRAGRDRGHKLQTHGRRGEEMGEERGVCACVGYRKRE